MKLLIVVCVIIIGLLGFGLFGIITDEVEEAKLSSLHTIDTKDMPLISVDKTSIIKSYSHRVSTYVNPSDDLIKEITLATDLDVDNYFEVFYYDQDYLIIESINKDEKLIELNPIHKELAIIMPKNLRIKTNLNNSDISYYALDENTHIMHILPKNTGLYELNFDDYKFKFECIEVK